MQRWANPSSCIANYDCLGVGYELAYDPRSPIRTYQRFRHLLDAIGRLKWLDSPQYLRGSRNNPVEWYIAFPMFLVFMLL